MDKIEADKVKMGEGLIKVKDVVYHTLEIHMVSSPDDFIEKFKVTATDLDDPNTDDNGLVTYSLEKGQELFKIDPQSGLVTAKVTLGRGIWRAEVIAEDGGGLTGVAKLVVTVGEVELELEMEEEEEMKAERRRRFVTEQQTRLDTLDSYCSTKKQWPGLNSNVIYVLQVLSAKFKFTTYQYIMIIIFLRNNS